MLYEVITYHEINSNITEDKYYSFDSYEFDLDSGISNIVLLYSSPVQEPGNKTVITSYSIHYTKLYEN